MSSLAPATRAQALAGAIEQSIVDDAFEAGDRLGTIEEWRERSGFARATVNEAMRLLVDRGIAEIRPGRGGGIFVAPDGAVVRLRHTLLSVRGEATTVADALVIREALEPHILLDAARSRTQAQMRDVRSKLRVLTESSREHSDFIQANWALHEAIAQITPNEMLRTMYLTTLSVICEHAVGATSDVTPGEDYRSQRIDIHRELVDAIDRADFKKLSRAIADHSRESTQ